MTKEPGTLLIVDDDEDVRAVLTDQVGRMGFRVLEADYGGAAIEALQRHKVDVVVSDLMMPGMSGLDLLQHMIGEGRLQPFIVLTGYPSQDSTLQALRLGAFDYVEKPFEADELRNLLNEALRVSRAYQVEGGKADGLADGSMKLKRLRALRQDAAPEGDSARGVDRFVAETEPQLAFCAAAIKGLTDANLRAQELGYLFRVYQAMAQAAQDVGESVVADLADAAARLYTLLRVVPRAYDGKLGGLAESTNRTIIELLTRPSERASTEPLARALESELRLAVETVERRSSKSSA